MSSPTYRSRGESNNYRGNYNRGGFQPRGQFRGRGGYNKPRRYWDNDDYYKRDRDYDRGRDRDRRRRSRSDSRSRSRSNSRSYSRSRSQSPSRVRSPRKPEEYKPKSATDTDLTSPGPTVTYQAQTAQYDPYNPQKDAKEGSWSGVVDPNVYVPQPQRSNGQQQTISNSNPYESSSEAIQLQLQQFQKYQQHLQQQRSQPSFSTEMNVSSSSTNSVANLYSFGSNAMAYQQATIPYPNQQVQQHHPSDISLDVSIGAIKPKREDGDIEKTKKKKDRKKKKRRRRSSSSSSSSSDDSSDSRTKRKSKRDSDDSSDSSSDEDKKKKDKGNAGSLTTEQKEAIMKQKESYSLKLEILDREINRLIIQEDELRSSKADIRLVEENFNLQAELKGRRKAVQIVLGKIGDVLNRAIQGTRTSHPVPPPPPKISQTPPPGYSHVPQVKKEDGLSNVEYYDNGVHWCRICNVFPETVVDLLNHCHSKDHQSQLQLMNISERPWQKKSDKRETKVATGAKRIPFRGVQFLSPVVGWYCRICSAWLGDHECAEQHFKSEEHNGAYLNFLAEHPDWETKWLTDRAKMLGTVTPDKNKRLKSRFDMEPESAALEEDGKSFRVHMRNTVKADENRTSAEISVKADTTSKDVSVEEWMSKPQKVKLDIIDTQKFAAIVRQKHGQKEKEELAKSLQHQQNKSFPSSAPQFNQRDSEPSKRDDYGPRDRRPSDANRRYERVEMQFSGSRDRDRYGGGGGLHRGARRRSRSRSRSRSRDRYNNRRRRSRERSRDRSRERSQRSKERSRSPIRGEREREKDKPDVKEQIRRLPMIGKMPLYKKPTATSSSTGKEKEKISEYGTEISSTDKGTEKVLQKIALDSKSSTNLGQHLHQHEESNMSEPSENSMTGFGANYNPSAGFNEDGFSGSNLSATVFSLDASNASGDEPPSLSVNTLFQPPSFDSKPTHVEKDLKPPGEKEPLAAGTGLPDDLQQALDIIYSGGGKPITVPPPSIPTGVPPPATTFGMTDFTAPNSSSYGNYMGYQPYQHSFDGYGPASGYDDLDDGPPGVNTAGSTTTPDSQTPAEEPPQKPEIQPEPAKAAPAPLDDDMEDLRMLGIDVDDVAVGGIR